MNLVGLNGFGFWYGRIDRYFNSGFFPYRWNWAYRHAASVIVEYTRINGMRPYIGIGFSDGATLLHEIAQLDERCVGFIAHSGMFRLPRTAQFRRPVPCLLLRTLGDITPTYDATLEAFDFYQQCHVDVSLKALRSSTWHGHEFANGLEAAREWCEEFFDYKLPIKTQQPINRSDNDADGI